MATLNIKENIDCDIHKVWEIVLAVEKYNQWRSDLSKAEIINKNQFIEYTKGDFPTIFTITVVKS